MDTTIWNDENRIGNFTSSKIGKLMTYRRDGKSIGKPALTYIKSKNKERRLGRAIDSESSAKPLSWGKILEGGIFNLLGLEYSLVSQETIQHQTIPYWSGSPDAIKIDKGEKTVIDIKAPITLNSFCDLVDPLYDGLTGIDAMNLIRQNHDDGDIYYWQLVSNAILTNSKYAELVVYVPYKDELDVVRSLASNYDGENLHKYYWIANAQDNELPFLIKDFFYKNLNIIRFVVPEEDKKALNERVLAAGNMLIPRILYPLAEVVVNVPELYGIRIHAANSYTPITAATEIKKVDTIEAFVKNVPPIASNELKEKAKKRLKEGIELKNRLKSKAI